MQDSHTQEFKTASVKLLLTIIQNMEPKKSKKYFNFFQKELDIDIEEFNKIKNSINKEEIDTSKSIDTIINELDHQRHQIMQFLMTLNRSIILDGCSVESYQKFEKIRDGFLQKIIK